MALFATWPYSPHGLIRHMALPPLFDPRGRTRSARGKSADEAAHSKGFAMPVDLLTSDAFRCIYTYRRQKFSRLFPMR
jgi:hypothetical protein